MIRKHTVDEVLKSLSRKRDVRIQGLQVQILSHDVWDEKKEKLVPNPRKSNDLGNGSLGKIDFLTKHCDYRREIVTKFDFK